MANDTMWPYHEQGMRDLAWRSDCVRIYRPTMRRLVDVMHALRLLAQLPVTCTAHGSWRDEHGHIRKLSWFDGVPARVIADAVLLVRIGDAWIAVEPPLDRPDLIWMVIMSWGNGGGLHGQSGNGNIDIGTFENKHDEHDTHNQHVMTSNEVAS